MYTLFIDTHDSIITISLINETNEIKKEIESERSHSVYLIPTIKELFEKNKITFNDIDSIIVVNGPGSFTGIRIGLSVAKTLAYTLNIPIKTISSLMAYIVSSENNKKASVIEDNKGYYVCAVDEKNNITIEEQYIEELNIDGYMVVDNKLNVQRIKEYLKEVKPINPHNVKANYVKKIEVLK